MRLKSALVVLAHKAPSCDILTQLFQTESEDDRVLRSIARNSNCSKELRDKCIAQLKQNHRDCFLGRELIKGMWSRILC